MRKMGQVGKGVGAHPVYRLADVWLRRAGKVNYVVGEVGVTVDDDFPRGSERYPRTKIGGAAAKKAEV